MKQRTKCYIVALLVVIAELGIGQANAAIVNITEGFENTATIFSYSTTGSVPYEIQNSEASHTGGFSFKANPSSCGASCFDSYRVDLLYNFDTPTMVQGISFWAREGSTSGTAWGGKIKVSHDSIWDLDWWGVVGNGQAITGDWQYVYIPINDMASIIDIRIWDITSRSSMWIDDVTIEVSSVPIPAAGWLLLSGLVGLITLGRKHV